MKIEVLSLIGLTLTLACGGGGSAGGATSGGGVPAHALQVTLSGDSPAWAAFQDGNGGWNPVTVSGGRAVLTVNDAAGRYGFAYGYLDVNGKRLTRVYQGTLAERPALASTLGTQAAPIVLTIPVTGLAPSEVAGGVFGRGSHSSFNGTTGQVTLTGPAGTADLALVAQDSTAGTARVSIAHNQNHAASATLAAVNSAAFTACPTVTVTATGIAPGTTVNYTSDLYLSGPTYFEVSYRWNSGGPIALPVTPSSQVGVSDLHYQEAYEYTDTTGRGYGKFSRTASDQTLPLPPLMAGALVYQAGAFTANCTGVPGTGLFRGSMRQATTSQWTVVDITPGWAGAAASYSYPLPNFQAISGSGWAFALDQPITWEIYAFGSSYWYKPDGTFLTAQNGDWDWNSFAYGSYTAVPPPVAPAPVSAKAIPQVAGRLREFGPVRR